LNYEITNNFQTPSRGHKFLNIWLMPGAIAGVVLLVWLVIKLGGESFKPGQYSDIAVFSDFVTLVPPQPGPRLGINIRSPKKPIHGGQGIALPKGATVASVMLDSPAERAGIRAGDIIERVNKDRIEHPYDLMKIIAQYKVGQTVRLTINRNGTRRPLNVKLGSLQNRAIAAAAKQAISQKPWLGLDVQPISNLLANQLGLPDIKGVVVSYVYQGSPAAQAGLSQGDVIKQIGETRIDNIKQLQTIMSGMLPGDTIHLQLVTNGSLQNKGITLAVKPAPQKNMLPRLPEAEVEIEAAWLGLDIVPLSAAERRELRLPANLQGILVDGIAQGPGVDAGIQVGDVIVAINGKSTKNIAAFQEATEGALGAVIDIVRAGRHQYISVPPPG
jgi:S1-C subfamily serine protease